MKKAILFLFALVAYFSTNAQGLTGTTNVCPNTPYPYSATTSGGGIGAGTYRWYLDGVWQKFAGISYSASINIPATSSSYLLSVVFTPDVGSAETYYLTLNSVSIGSIAINTSEVCYGGSVSVTKSGFMASTATWQKKEGAGAWTDDPFPGTGNYGGQVYVNPTGFRLKTNDCGTIYSNEVYVTVDPNTVGGSVSVNQGGSVCGSGTAGLSISGNVGTITQWNVRYLDTSWSTPITFSTSSSTSISYPVVSGSGLTRTYEFTAVTKSGLCNSVTSAPGYFVVNTISAGTANINTAHVCYGSSVNLSMSGQQGVQTIWQLSTDGGSSWGNITSSGTSNYSTAVYQNLSFRMLFGTCGPSASNSVSVIVDPLSVGGSVNVNQGGSVCGSGTAGLSVSGNVGTITEWNVRYFDTSWSAPVTFSTSSSTSITYPVVSGPGLTRTYEFTAVSKNGLCSSAASAVGIFVVNTISAGTAAINTTQVCYGSSVNLSMSGQQGVQTIWQQSVNGGAWTDIASSGTSNYSPVVNQNTSFRMRFGTCGPPNSNSVSVIVDPLSVGGSVTVDQGGPECGPGTVGLSMSGNVGTVTQWNVRYFDTSWSAPTTFSASSSTSVTYPVVSGPGLTRTYEFTAVSTSGVCNGATSTRAFFVVNTISAGTAAINTSQVCYGSTVNLSMSGQQGIQTIWQQSVNGGAWTDITSSGTSNYSPVVNQNTSFRMRFGTCGPPTSNSVGVTVDPLSVGGSISVNQGGSICGSGTAGLSVSGNIGTITQWNVRYLDTSWSAPVTFSTSSSASITYPVVSGPGLIRTYEFTAVSKNGLCNGATSVAGYFVVNTISTGTAAINATQVCNVSSVNLSMSGQQGVQTIWQQSVNGGAWTDITSSGTSNYSPVVNQNTSFRMRFGTCGPPTSNSVSITVDPLSVGGSISVDQGGSVCGSGTAGLTVSGNVGTITQWNVRYLDTSWSAPVTFSTSSSASITYPVVSGPGLTRTYEFTAVSKSGVCNSATSAARTFVVNTLSAGTAAINITHVCYGSSVNLSMSGQQGVQTIWQQSTNGGASWSNIASSGGSSYSTAVYQNISFRMLFGTCGPGASNSVSVIVDPLSAGGTISVDQSGSVCGPGTAGLTVSGNVGTVTQWNVRYYDTSWSAPSTFSTSSSASITYPVVSGPGLTRTYEFTAVSASGLCNSATSAARTFVVNTISAGTAAINATNVCYGSTVNLSLSGQQGVQTIWQQSVNGGAWTDIASSGTSNYSPVVNQNTSFRMRFGTCGPSTSNSVSVAVDPLSMEGTLSTSTTPTCNSGTASLSLVGNTGTITNWYVSYKDGTGSFNTPTSFSASASSTNTYPITSGAGLSRTYQFYATVKSGLCPATNSSVAQAIVNPTTIAGTITSNQPVESYGVSSATLTLGGYTGSIVGWQQLVGAIVTDIANTSATLVYTNVTATKQYRAVVQSGVCGVQYSPYVTISIYDVPTIQFVGGTNIAIGGTTTIVSSTSYYSYQWIKNGVDIAGASTSSLTVTEPANYSLRIKATATSPPYTTGNAVIKEGITNQSVKINFVASTTFLKEGINDGTNLFALTPADLMQQIQYSDGLGRIVQTTNIGASPTGADIIQPVYFDAAGKEAVSILPYSRSVRDGRYTTTAIDNSGYATSEQYLFYQNVANGVHDVVPYSQTYFEASPLSRPDKQYGAGQSWRISDKYIKYGYSTNANGTSTGQEKIIAWGINASGFPVKETFVNTSISGGYYTTGQLSIKSTKDEQGNEVREYVDKMGHTILKKVQAFDGIAQINNDHHWAMTYYIYNDRGNLVVVLPPEAVKALTGN